MSINWSEQEDAILRGGRAAGEAYESLSRLIGRSSTACRIRAQALGIAERRKAFNWTSAAIQTVIDGYKAGRRCEDIARDIGCSPDALYRKASSLDLRHPEFREQNNSREYSAQRFEPYHNPALDRAPARLVARIKANPVQDEQSVSAEINQWNLENPHARLTHVGRFARTVLASLNEQAAS